MTATEFDSICIGRADQVLIAAFERKDFNMSDIGKCSEIYNLCLSSMYYFKYFFEIQQM